jgi:folate-binding protein YgfZ
MTINTEWHIFLNNAGANAELPLQAKDNGFCALTDYGLLKVSGADAASFLQGQATCDINALAPGRSTPGALCTPKGRVIANFLLLRSEWGFYLLLSADLVEIVRKRLQIYVLRAKVLLENLSPRHGIIGVLGSGFEAELNGCEMKIPDEPGTWLERPDHFMVRLADGSGRCLIAAETGSAQRLWSCLAERLTQVSPNFWRLKDIEAGIPKVVAATTEEFLPQMLNLDVLGGIGFNKGCYTGQEIVTRSHYLGQVKRRMFRLRCSAGVEPVSGTPIYDRSEAEPKNVGQVVQAALGTQERYQVLAVIGLDHAQSESLRLAHPDGPGVEFLPLPYSPGLIETPQSRK